MSGGGSAASHRDEARTFCSLAPATQQAILAYPDLVNLCFKRYAEVGSTGDCLLELLNACPEILTAVDNRVYQESALGCAILRKRIDTSWVLIQIAERHGIAARVLRHRNSSGHTLLMLAVDLDTETEGGPLINRLLDEWPEQVHTCYDSEGRNVLHHCAVDGRYVSLGIILRYLIDKGASPSPSPSLIAVASAFGVPDSVERLTPIHYMAKSCRLDMLQTVAEFAAAAQLTINFDQPWPIGRTPLALAAVADSASATKTQETCRWLVKFAGSNPRTALADVKTENPAAKELLSQLVAELPESAFSNSDDDEEEDAIDDGEQGEEEEAAMSQVDAAIDEVQRLRVVDKQMFNLSDSARRRLADSLRASNDDASRFLTALSARCPSIASAGDFLALSPEPILLCLSLMAATSATSSNCSSAGSSTASALQAVGAALCDIGRQDLVHVLTDSDD